MCVEKAVENTKDESGISIFNDTQRYSYVYTVCDEKKIL